MEDGSVEVISVIATIDDAVKSSPGSSSRLLRRLLWRWPANAVRGQRMSLEKILTWSPMQTSNSLMPNLRKL